MAQKYYDNWQIDHNPPQRIDIVGRFRVPKLPLRALFMYPNFMCQALFLLFQPLLASHPSYNDETGAFVSQRVFKKIAMDTFDESRNRPDLIYLLY